MYTYNRNWPYFLDMYFNNNRGQTMNEKEKIEQAFKTLALLGVPEERARSISNGINVLTARYDRDIYFLNVELQQERQAKKELVEALEITNKFLNNINGHVKDNVMDSYLSKLTLDNDELLNKHKEKK